MDKNKKILKTGLILIGVTLLLSISTFFFLKIKRPVFLNHYYEYQMYLLNEDDLYYSVGHNIPIRLQYVTNVSDDRQVTGISFKEAPDLNVNASEYEPTNFFSGMFQTSSNNNTLGTNIGRYNLRNVYLSLYVPIDSVPDKLELSEAVIHFNNTEQLEVNIGKLILCKEEQPERDYLKRRYSSSSSNGESNSPYDLLDDITIKTIDSPLLDKLNKYINLKVNNEEYTAANGKEYKKGETIFISYTLNPDVASDFIRFGFDPKLYYQNSQGNTYYERLFIEENDFYSKPSFLDIIKYVKFNR